MENPNDEFKTATIVFLSMAGISVLLAILLSNTHQPAETTKASPRNDQQYIRADVETGRIKCAVELDSNGKCSEWIIYKTIKE